MSRTKRKLCAPGVLVLVPGVFALVTLVVLLALTTVATLAALASPFFAPVSAHAAQTTLVSTTPPSATPTNQAYAFYDDSAKKLIFFRAPAGKYGTQTTQMPSFPLIEEINVSTESSDLVITNFEDVESPSSSDLGWRQGGLAQSIVAIQFAQSIAPLSCQSWFSGFQALSTVESAHNLDLSRCTSLRSMFQNCVSLAALDMSGAQTPMQPINLNFMFAWCNNLERVDFPSTGLMYVSSMSLTFVSCQKLQWANVASWRGEKCDNAGSTFADCSSLESLDLSHFGINRIGNAGDMFNGCANLKSLNLSGFVTTRCTSFRNMFAGCSSLESLDLSDLSTTWCGGGGMYGFFKGCTRLKTIILGANTWFLDVALPEHGDEGGAYVQNCWTAPDGTPRYYTDDVLKNWQGGAGILAWMQQTGKTNTPMYRLYNRWTQEHFYTASIQERDSLIAKGWNDEQIGWYAPPYPTADFVYRLYNPYTTDHHYTMHKAEYDRLCEAGWSGEGIGWYSDEAQSLPIWREYNPWLDMVGSAGAHNYTSSEAEHRHLVSIGWRDEQIGWYGVAWPE